MASILGFNIPIDLNAFMAGGIATSITLILLFVVFALICLGVAYLIIDYRTYNRRIIIFENDGSGHYHQTGRDRARLIKVGDGGEEVLYLKKRKVFRSAYGRKMSKNSYWFAVGQDGYWYNIILGDLDAKMGMLDIEPIDRDMRYMHVALRKNAERNYLKQKFMEKYGTLIINGVFLIIMLIAMWFIIERVATLISEASSIVSTIGQACEPTNKALSLAIQTCEGGTGLVPA